MMGPQPGQNFAVKCRINGENMKTTSFICWGCAFLISLVFSVSGLAGAQDNALAVTSYEAHSSGDVFTTMNYYEILGVDVNASEEEIKAAYRRAAMKWHPDRNSGSKESEVNFKLIKEAYEILMDADKRAHYDRFGKGDGSASVYVSAFIRMSADERKAFLEKWLWDDNGENVLESLIKNLQFRADTSVAAFQALISIHRHRHQYHTAAFKYMRMHAFEALTLSDPHRPEALQDYLEVLTRVFKAHSTKNSARRYSLGSNGGYYVGTAIRAFFSDQNLDPEVFRALLPKMGRMLPKSHSVAWVGLLKSLKMLNTRFPEQMPAILQIYEKGLSDLDRPILEDPKRPEWLYGRIFHTVAETSDVGEGLLEIARLRPDLGDRVYKALVRYPKLFATGLITTLMRAAEQNQMARLALLELLSGAYTAEEIKMIKAHLEREEANLRRNKRNMAQHEIQRTKEILDLVRKSSVFKGSSKSVNLCMRIFK